MSRSLPKQFWDTPTACYWLVAAGSSIQAATFKFLPIVMDQFGILIALAAGAVFATGGLIVIFGMRNTTETVGPTLLAIALVMLTTLGASTASFWLATWITCYLTGDIVANKMVRAGGGRQK